MVDAPISVWMNMVLIDVNALRTCILSPTVLRYVLEMSFVIRHVGQAAVFAQMQATASAKADSGEDIAKSSTTRVKHFIHVSRSVSAWEETHSSADAGQVMFQPSQMMRPFVNANVDPEKTASTVSVWKTSVFANPDTKVTNATRTLMSVEEKEV